jgi:hypothetical protein
MRLKIFLPVFIIVLIILAYFGYPVIKNRYFNSAQQAQSDQENVISNDANNKSRIENTDTSEQASAEDTTENTEGDTSQIEPPADEGGNFDNITADDCDNECVNFKSNDGNYKYCRDICGLSLTDANNNCGEKQEPDKDYCFKNQAILKTDLKICDSISDTKIKSSCQSRVTEDIVDKR